METRHVSLLLEV